jgi:4a-hydroxytetrahydrobiopterin dehydratase
LQKLKNHPDPNLGGSEMALLNDAEIETHLATLKGWTRDGDAIKKQFTFSGFPDAVAFVQRLVPDCEAADHHPDITINYRRVTLSYATHSEGGITLKDIDGAKNADRTA